MARLTLLALALLTSVATAAPGAVQANKPSAPVFRHASADDAWRAAQKSQRPVLLFVSSQDCRYCSKMLKDTYSNPQLAAALSASCEPVSLMSEDNQALVKKLQIRAFPTTVVVAVDGSVLAKIEGYQPPQKFAELMFGRPQPAQAAVRPASATAPVR